MHRLVVFLAAAVLPPFALPQQAEQSEHFERHVRPLLVENCYACHSAETMAMGELRLDSKEALLRGGTRGAAVVPGDPAASLLLKAVSYSSLDLRMPPSGRLSDQEIEHLEAWISMGAPDPRTEEAQDAHAGEESVDLEEGRQFWSLRPLGNPDLPAIENQEWARTGVDRFVLARLESSGLATPAPADQLALVRRLTFDLTGLPPAQAEVEAFLRDDFPDAYGAAVDRLLSSPHYGERWGRHWLDLVRWAETNGHEFDNNKLDAWRYRDYVIDSFNADLPYDRFLREQIAGDLLPPRVSADRSHFVSPLGSGMLWLWEVLNSPTDSVKARADQIDNQIDVLTKATQGLTVACARCHDHKFDPIPTADYYSLFGVLASTHLSETCVDSPSRAREIQSMNARAGEANRVIEARLLPALAAPAQSLAEQLLAAAGELEADEPSRLGAELRHALSEPSHPLYPFARTAAEEAEKSASEPSAFAAWMVRLREEMADWALQADPSHPIWQERGDTVFEDFEQGFSRWTSSGAAFADGPTRTVPPGQSAGGFAGQAVAASFGRGADSLVGTLTTEKFRMPARHVHVRMAGPAYTRAQRENAPVRFTVIADEHKSGHAMPAGSGRLQWHSIAMTKERDRTCSIEIVDRDRKGSIVVDKVVFSSHPKPPPIAGPVSPRVLDLLVEDDIRSLEDLAVTYQALARDLAGRPDLASSDRALLSALLGLRQLEDAVEYLPASEQSEVAEWTARRAAVERAMPASTFAMTSRDWQPADSPVHVRGNHKNLGEVAPRRYLQAVAGSNQKPFRIGSGRLELAHWIASASNPLTARVMVNRIWHHHFGRGIVASVDNFGRMGEEPSHPALLDYLARRFVESGWSVKAIHREILLSSTYRAASGESERARQVDPANRLLSHFPVRRLEAEAIRDAVLAVSGSLDPALGGPSVPPHISVYQDGRGKPESGPLDGLGRRSVYLQVRRNFLPPLFLAFDYPLPISTAGRRGVSAVSSQALLMLNNEFIQGQADLWARRMLQLPGTSRDRVRTMYMASLGRPPVESELEEVERFLDRQGRRREGEGGSREAWTDLAHAVLNTAEFLFVR